MIRLKLGVVALICAVGLSAGCVRRVVIVPTGEPLRLRSDVIGAEVWVVDADGKERPGVADLPAGWWALPDPGPEPERGEPD